MGKKHQSADDLAKRAIKNNPIFVPDEPNIIGNPDNLRKSDKEIEDEELRQERSKGQKRGDSESGSNNT